MGLLWDSEPRRELVAKEGDAGLLQVDTDLVYTTSSVCDAAAKLPSGEELATRLLPEDAAFHGHMQLSKAASGDGCALYLAVKGAVAPRGDADVFDVAKTLDQSMTKLLAAGCRGGMMRMMGRSSQLEDMALASVVVNLEGDKHVTVSLKPSEAVETSESVMTVKRGVCTELLAAVVSADDAKTLSLEKVLPRQVDGGQLDVTKESSDESSECAVSLEVTGLAPRLSNNGDVFQLLKAVDGKMGDFFAQVSGVAELTSVNVRLQTLTAGTASETESLAAAASSSTSGSAFNSPPYEVALGIIAGFAMLVGMLMAVVVQKKRGEQRSRDHYERANRAAQIHRVSLRMNRKDEEGEQDSLL